MDIVDSQVHLFLTMDAQQALATMDSLGIQAALSDEYWGMTPDGKHPMPCIQLPGGAHRPVAPGSQMAAMRHPERFGYLLRVDQHDPELEAVIRLAKADPGCKALRVEARSEDQLRDLREGRYSPVFLSAAKHGLPVFFLSPGNAPLIEPYLRDFPKCRIVVDHIGMPATRQGFEHVLRFAKYTNAYLKWCHPHRTFANSDYPFPEAIAGLGEAVGAFGARRIMWASDFTVVRTGRRWADLLFYLRDTDRISEEDKRWILGASVRELTGWTAPETLATPPMHRH